MNQPSPATPPDSVTVELQPLGKRFAIRRGGSLQNILFAEGVEFPCGGRGRCKGCRVKILSGGLPITESDRRLLTAPELESGWRLACAANPTTNLAIELAQWDTPILSDDTVFSFVPSAGLGIAVDLGTTTVVAQLLDLQNGHVLGVRTALNPQARHGADIMSRIEFALRSQGQPVLARLIREQIARIVHELLAESGRSEEELQRVVLVGNTAMHHLFCGIDVTPLAGVPFESENPGLQTFHPEELGWKKTGHATIQFLPCLGGFVGSDVLAGAVACKIGEADRLDVLIDLGTNGEIVVGNREKMFCASTAAGPAFEGAKISMGMRAASGAISQVTLANGALQCRVIGDGPARGICGSGLVDAVAAGLQNGAIQPSGRLCGAAFPLLEQVHLTQNDIRELQLAKGAIAAGLRILLNRFGATANDVHAISLAGAFGNYISRQSAQRIGLLSFPIEKIRPAGNTALLGAKLALFETSVADPAFEQMRARIEHVPLHEDLEFQETFIEEMRFP